MGYVVHKRHFAKCNLIKKIIIISFVQLYLVPMTAQTYFFLESPILFLPLPTPEILKLNQSYL